MNMTEMVREFHCAFLVECPDKPELPGVEVTDLRWRLIDEENAELLEAPTVVEALDAIADLLYVVHGAALAYGFTGEQVDAAFAEVHRSNMSKLWTDDELANAPADCIARPVGDGRFVVTRPDGKVVKSPSYSTARLEAIVGGDE